MKCSKGKVCIALVIIYLLFGIITVNGMVSTQAPYKFAETFDLEEFEGFVDNFFYEKMEEYDIPGAVFTAVKNGEIILNKGYGYARLETGNRANPKATQFRIASVSKLFTAIAILQLHEEGKIGLNEDVNTILRAFKVKNPFQRPLTVADLLMHTDGFEERNTRIFALDSNKLLPLVDVLKSDLKPVVVSPGEKITYGSFSTALASYIVEEVSGIPFNSYVEERILRPLEMRNTTIEQAVSEELMEQIATIYNYKDGEYVAAPFLYITTPATGGISSSGEDMAKLLLMLLGKGSYRGNKILSNNTIDEMFNQQFTPHEKMPGVTYGFFEHYENGLRGLLREGSGLGVNSRVFLLPEKDFAFFIAYNTRGSDLSEKFTSDLLDKYFPENKIQTQSELPTTKSRVGGTYRYVQYSRNTITKISSILASIVKVKENGDGSLMITPLLMGDPYGGFEEENKWFEIEPLVYQREDGKGLVAFKTDRTGRITELVSGQGYHGCFERIGWYEAPVTHLGILVIFLISFITAAFMGLIKIHKEPSVQQPIKRLYQLLVSISLLNGIFILTALPVSFLYGVAAGFPSIAFVDGANQLLYVLLLLPIISAILTLTMTYYVYKSCRGYELQISSKIYFFSFTIVCFLFFLYLHYWRLLGYNF